MTSPKPSQTYQAIQTERHILGPGMVYVHSCTSSLARRIGVWGNGAAEKGAGAGRLASCMGSWTCDGREQQDTGSGQICDVDSFHLGWK